MIKTTISEVFSSSYGPEGCRGLVTEGSGADGPDVAGSVFIPNGPLAHIQLVGEPEDEPKAD